MYGKKMSKESIDRGIKTRKIKRDAKRLKEQIENTHKPYKLHNQKKLQKPKRNEKTKRAK